MFPKPEPLARTRRRKVRIDRGTQGEVRAFIFDREQETCAVVSRLSQDETLAIFKLFGICWGVLTPAHLHGHRRSATMNQDPLVRHSSAHELSLCVKHHHAEEHLGLRFVPQTEDGCDGPITWAVESPKSMGVS
jgi:hypothetical protein